MPDHVRRDLLRFPKKVLFSQFKFSFEDWQRTGLADYYTVVPAKTFTERERNALMPLLDNDDAMIELFKENGFSDAAARAGVTAGLELDEMLVMAGGPPHLEPIFGQRIFKEGYPYIPPNDRSVRITADSVGDFFAVGGEGFGYFGL